MKGIGACVAAVGVCFGMVAHGVSLPIGMNRAATLHDRCAESPMDSTDHATYDTWYGLWDGDAYREPFTLGRLQEGVTTSFGTASERAFRSGRAHITVQIDDAYPENRDRMFKLVGRALASLPSALLQRIPPTTLEFSDFEQHETFDRAVAWAGVEWVAWHGPGDWEVRHYVRVLSKAFGPGFEEVLLHEFAHVMDHHIPDAAARVAGCVEPGDSDCGAAHAHTDAWQAAMEGSACAVSEYATTNAQEDFAESVLAWFGYYAGRQGRLEPSARSALRERLGKRFGVLNRLMHDRFGQEERR